MTQDEIIIAMAREAGFEEGWVEVCNVREELTNLYNLGRAHEREACAKVCEELSERYLERCKNFFDERYAAAEVAATECAAAIRARNNKE